MAGDPERAEVKAAGAVVHRQAAAAGGTEVLLVHRPKYDDWSLPKGKLDPGEGWEQAAVREVEEETGERGVLGPELAPVFYADRRGRPKAVRYWLLDADPAAGAFAANDEVDEVRWLSLDAALDRLSREADRSVLREAAEVLAR